MLKPTTEAQRRIVEAFSSESSDVDTLLDPFEYLASANDVVPMLLDLAVRRANEVVDHVPRFSSADHAAVWSDLLACLARFDGFQVPYFTRAEASDPFAEELHVFEHNKILRAHVVASFERGLWTLVDDGNGLRIRLAAPMRRSALQLLANKVRLLATPQNVRDLLADPETTPSEVALATGIRDLEIFAESSRTRSTLAPAPRAMPAQTPNARRSAPVRCRDVRLARRSAAVRCRDGNLTAGSFTALTRPRGSASRRRRPRSSRP